MVLPQPECCDSACSQVPVPGPPGDQGTAGTNGTNGTNGLNAWDTVAAGFTMPALGDTVQITLTTGTDWLVEEEVPVTGHIIVIQFAGYFKVVSVDSATEVTIENLEDSDGHYSDNVAPGTSIPINARVSSAGLQGLDGIPDANALIKTNNLNDVTNVGDCRDNLGLGTVATFDQGNADGEIPRVDDASGLTDGEVVFATADGLETKNDSDTRSAIGLGSAAVLDAGNTVGSVPFVDVANLNNAEVVVATASGIRTQTAAAVRALIGASAQDILLFRDERATTIDSDGFSAGSWEVCPLNTEEIDTGNHGSINGSSEITLDAGTYRYTYAIMCWGGESLQGRLYNVTDGAPIDGAGENSYGQVVKGVNDTTLLSTGQGRFTLASGKTITLQGFRGGGGGATWGDSAGFGGPEIYSFLQLVVE